MRRHEPKWTLRRHWRTAGVFMLLFGASYFVRPGWLQVVWLLLWFVAFNIVVRRQLGGSWRSERVHRRLRGRRSIVAVAAFVVVAVLAVGLVRPTDVWRVKLSGDGLTLALLKPSADEAGRILFEDDFSDRSGEWNARDKEAALVEYSGGGLRMLVRDDETINFELRSLTDDVDGLRAEVDATVLAGGEGIVIGLICAVSAGIDARQAGGRGAYVAVIEPAALRFGIGHVRSLLEAGFELTESLQQGGLPGGEPLGRTIRLAAECRGGGNGRRNVSLWVNERRVGAGSHTATSAQFDGIGLVVVSGRGDVADVRFDNVVVRDLSL